MKRQTLLARVEYLHEKEEALAGAAERYANKIQNTNSSSFPLSRMRRDLREAAIAYGTACKRYLGGRE